MLFEHLNLKAKNCSNELPSLCHQRKIQKFAGKTALELPKIKTSQDEYRAEMAQ